MITTLYIRNHHGNTIDACKVNNEATAHYMRARYSRLYPDYICKAVTMDNQQQVAI